MTTSVRLGEVCTFLNGGTPKRSVARYFEGDIPWITGADIAGPVACAARSFITEEAIAASATNRVDEGAVLLVTRTSVGKVAVAGRSLCFSQDITALLPDSKKLDAQFLVHFLKTQQAGFEREARGATIKGITRAVVADRQIPLPPLEEQRRIAAILDQAETLRFQRRAAIAQLDSLGQAIFVEMFGDVLQNDRQWPATTLLGEVANIASGITKGRKLGAVTARNVPYMAVVNVQDKALNLDTVKTIDATEAEIAKYKLQRDDLLLTEGGDPDKLGRGTLWREELPESIHQNHIFRVRLESEALRPVFLNWLVGSERGKRYFLRSAKQTTGIASINMTQLRSFPLLLPPVALQDQFAQRIEALQTIRATHQAALSETDQLFASLQHRAFRGGLTPDGRRLLRVL